MIKSVQAKMLDRTEGLNRYLEDIRKYDLISPEEEVELVLKAQNGDEQAMGRLMESHQRYIFSFARQYSNGKNILDLVNVANEGFAIAIERFDVTRGFRLCSYANSWMQERLNSYLLTDHLLVKRSNYKKTHSKVNKIKNDFFLQNGRYPSNDEVMDILDEMGIKINNECDVYDVTYNSINASLDEGETFYEGSEEFNSHTSSNNNYEDVIDSDYNKTLVNIMLNGLKEKEREIIKSLFGIGCEEKDMDTVAEEMGFSKERIRQLKVATLDKLKRQYKHYTKKAI